MLRSEINADFKLGSDYPCLDDRDDKSGTARGHYFHQDLRVAQKIHEANPSRHIDVGSRIDGFVAHVASFRSLEVVDIRPLDEKIPNVIFRQADLMSDDVGGLGVSDSVSCLHALEHFGLGRYGDPLDPNGWRKGLRSLHKMTTPGGTLYLSIPIGPQRIEFDAHRVFEVSFLRQFIRPYFEVRTFCYVDDHGELRETSLDVFEKDTNNFGCWYGCGIFELIRRPDTNWD